MQEELISCLEMEGWSDKQEKRKQIKKRIEGAMRILLNVRE